MPTASVAIEGASALNRVRWAQGGKEVAVGDSEGRIWIYDVGEVHICDVLFCFIVLFVERRLTCEFSLKTYQKLFARLSGPQEPSQLHLQISIDFRGSLLTLP